MTLTWTVAAAVLLAALLHAAWNALVKSSADKALDSALIHVMGSFIALPVVAVLGWPPAAAWPYLAGSVAIHLGYYIALAGAYRHGDLGLTYPLMRGVAPLLVAISAGAVLGEPLSAMSWAGVVGVSCGVLVLGLSPQALQQPRAVAFALANAVLIAMYTVVDGLGVRSAGSALQYVCALFLLNCWPFGLLVVWQRGPAAAWTYARARWPLATCGAVASLAAYGIALWAMTQAPIATVAALRETSVLFAALLGTWFLRERFTPRRITGTLVILGGVMALRLG